jgi:hypothetical protein
MKKFSEFLLSDSTSVKSNVVKEQEEVAPEDSAPEVEKTRGSITIGFGRFNPPTSGHGKLCDAVKNVAGEGEYRIYPSHSCDSKKNPLDCEEKVNWMKASYPDHASNIVYDSKMKTIFDVLQAAHNGGYRSVNLVVGSDRLKEFERLANDYNGQLYSFDKINVISAGDRNPDAEGVEGMSASKLRKAAAEGDYETFEKGLSKNLKQNQKKELYNSVRLNMGVVDVEEEVELWEIAPKFDWRNLRENYLNKNIFNVGDFVESVNTGLVGKVIRRGTNYLICVTKEGYLFKSWIKDLSEVNLIGTNSYREYVQGLTPREKIQSFINKSKRRSRTAR